LEAFDYLLCKEYSYTITILVNEEKGNFDFANHNLNNMGFPTGKNGNVVFLHN
jgi:hypothetical protein